MWDSIHDKGGQDLYKCVIFWFPRFSVDSFVHSLAFVCVWALFDFVHINVLFLLCFGVTPVVGSTLVLCFCVPGAAVWLDWWVEYHNHFCEWFLAEFPPMQCRFLIGGSPPGLFFSVEVRQVERPSSLPLRRLGSTSVVLGGAVARLSGRFSTPSGFQCINTHCYDSCKLEVS